MNEDFERYSNDGTVHDSERLKELQKLPLHRKIGITSARIIEWHNHFNGQVYVSFSGGKDSTVLLHIARQLFPDIEAVFCDTGLEYPEIREFVKTIPNVRIIKPEKNFRNIILEYGYPIISKEVAGCIDEVKRGLERDNNYNSVRYEKLNGTLIDKRTGKLSIYNIPKYKYLLNAPFKISNKCCYYSKKAPLHKFEAESGKKSIQATMACESQLRRQGWIRTGCNAFHKKPQSKPMSFWTEQDVLMYLALKKIPYCEEIYGYVKNHNGKLKMSKRQRTGCVYCGFGAHLEKEPNRFQELKESHYKIWEYCMKSVDEGGLGMRKVLDFINVKCEKGEIENEFWTKLI